MSQVHYNTKECVCKVVKTGGGRNPPVTLRVTAPFDKGALRANEVRPYDAAARLHLIRRLCRHLPLKGKANGRIISAPTVCNL